MADIRIGTSGFSYKEWKPLFYPADLPQRRFLEHYASELRAVEIDSTFYRMPKESTLEAWNEATSSDFRFAIKASRRITHWERLRLPSDALDYLVRIVQHLGDRLGVVLFQLPPNFKADVDRLEAFLDNLPRPLPCVFEFRHESWFSDEVYVCLEKHGRGLVIHDADDHTTPTQLTAKTAYVRLRKSGYSAEERRAWLDQFRAWQSEGIDVYGFIKHTDNPEAPLIAREFAKAVGQAR